MQVRSQKRLLISFLSVVLLLSSSVSSARRNEKEGGLEYCTEYHLESKPFSFADELMPDTQRRAMGGVSRKDKQAVYRTAEAANPQFNLERVIRAIFKDPTAVVGSAAHFLITQWIQNKTPTLARMADAQLAIEEDPEILTAVGVLQKCHAKHRFTEGELLLLASDLLDKKFRLKVKQNLLAALYIDEGHSSSYRNYAAEVIFSSYQPMVSSIYGSKTLIFKESSPRHLDKEYWMASKYGQVTCAGLPDVQETMSPGYILPDAVRGMIKRETDDHFPGGHATQNKETSWMVHEWKLSDGSMIAAVFDTKRNWAPVMLTDGLAYAATADLSPTTASRPPTVEEPTEKHILPILGIVSDCEEPCTLAKNYLKNYPKKSARSILLSETREALETIKGANPSSKLHLIETDPPTHIKILKALWGTQDVTPNAEKFCNGRIQCGYKVSVQYAFSKQPSAVPEGDFVITYTCESGKNAKDAKTLTVSSVNGTAAEGQVLKLVCDSPAEETAEH